MKLRDQLHRRAPLLALFAVVLIAFAGCGSDDDDSGSDSGTTDTETTQTETETTEETTSPDDATGQVVEVAVKSGELKFDPDTLTATAGKVTFKFTNPDGIPHDFVVEQDGERIDGTDLVSDGSAEVTIDLKAGEYDFYCTPHKSSGMTGKLTVT